MRAGAIGRIAVELAAVILALALPGAAAASPGWQAPLDVSAPAGASFDPAIALDDEGDAVAVWHRQMGIDYVVEAATRPAGGSWQVPTALSPPGQDSFGAQVALDGEGGATVVWCRSDGFDYVVQASTRAAGGPWQSPVDLSVAGRGVCAPQVAVNRAGDAVAVWRGHDGSGYVVQAAARSRGGSWQPSVDLSAAGGSAHVPQVVIDDEGNATAVWQRHNGSFPVVQAATRPAGGPWGSSVDLPAPGDGAGVPQIALAGDGTVTVVWRRATGPTPTVQAVTRSAGGAWQAPIDLSDPGQPGTTPQIDVNDDGDAIAVWEREAGSEYVTQAARRPAGGTWQPPVDLSSASVDITVPQVALDDDGDATAVWQQSDGSGQVIQAATRPAAGSWHAPVDVSAPGQSSFPQIARDPQGNATAVWYRSDNGPVDFVQSAVLDAAGPALDGLSVPSTGTTGETLAFSVSPFDRWSVLGATTWTFGDGTSSIAASATHAYANPGTYALGLSSADALGNVTSTERTIVISAPVVPGRPPTSTPTPRITDPGQLRRVWRRSGPRATNTPRAKVGTTFTFTLDTPATVRLSFARQLTGRRRGTLCQAPSPANRRGRPCTRSIPSGSLTHTGTAGPNSLPFAGDLTARARLVPGDYVFTLSPLAGNPVSKTLRFTIVG